MEQALKSLEIVKKDLRLRYENLQQILSGKEFTNKSETPWLHTMDNERRQRNRYISKYDLDLAISDFQTILNQIKKMK